ncbi:hypothetical protein D3C77_589930 [compost metagenome]
MRSAASWRINRVSDSACNPVSSSNSRSAACTGVSPGSILPPGRVQAALGFLTHNHLWGCLPCRQMMVARCLTGFIQAPGRIPYSMKFRPQSAINVALKVTNGGRGTNVLPVCVLCHTSDECKPLSRASVRGFGTKGGQSSHGGSRHQ